MFENVLKDLKKNFGNTIASIGVDQSQKTYFSLGTPTLDFCTYNSIPEGCFIELSGKEGSAKTTGAFLLAKSFTNKELLKPIEERRGILFVDAECTLDPTWALTSAGYDVNSKEVQTLYFAPEGQSAEEIFNVVTEVVKSGECGLVIFDSLTAIAGEQVINDKEGMKKKDMANIASILRDFVRRNTGLFKKYHCTFIGINGTTINLSPYGNPETTGGGTYWKRACSLRLRFKQGDFFDEEGNALKSTAESPAGHIVQVAVLKTKICRWDRKLGSFHLNYTKGIDLLADTIDIAISFDFIKASGAWFSFIDPKTGEVLCDGTGKPIKVNGMKRVKEYLNEHKDVWKLLYDAVYEKLSIKDDPNIKSFEEMLNIDVQKEFNLDFEKERLSEEVSVEETEEKVDDEKPEFN